MDISSNNSYPSNKLTNFAAHSFVLDGIQIASMEGFLQSLKFKDIPIQNHVCSLVGRAAKAKGRNKKWFKTQILYWQGVEYKRDSQEYQDLLDRAYEALSENKNFQRALKASGNSILTHSLGKRKITDTVLTEQEFCSRLMKIRERLNG